MDALLAAAAKWKVTPTEENARAYHATWMDIHRNNPPREAGTAEWFYCSQPKALWDQLDTLGLKSD